jgi:hypothetical protein
VDVYAKKDFSTLLKSLLKDFALNVTRNARPATILLNV